jgi:predicted RNA-binding protein with PUA-like domain
MRYWLMKCEPAAYTIEDLKRDKVTSWEGVRNFQARNFMRDRMQVGDPVLFYASNAEPSGVTGLAKIARAGYPDQYAFKPGHKYYDPDSDKGTPVWYMVDVEPWSSPRHAAAEATKLKGLEDMMVVKRARLSGSNL